MTKPDRAPNSIWCLNLNRIDVAVRTEADDSISIVGPDYYGGTVEIVLPRNGARLLAKRINQCLDDTTMRALRKRTPAEEQQ